MKRGAWLAAAMLAGCGGSGWAPPPDLVLFRGESRPAGHAVHAGTAMGSDLRIEVYGPDQGLCDRAVEAALSEIRRLDDMMTDWRDGSPLMEINHQAGRQPVAVPEELFFLIRRSVELSRLTDGAFDISFAGAGRLWNWRQPRIPGDDEIRAALENVGWRDIVLDEQARSVFLRRPGMRIGLGAIAPGYAGDRAMGRIRDLGLRDAVVDLSGDLMISGRRDGRSWPVYVRHPRAEGHLAVLPVSNAAVSTSGDYERYFEREGRRYCHIIDPRTGRPADGCQSVTVVAPSLAVADGLATALFVLGPARGLELAERMEGVEALIVAADGSVTATSGLVREEGEGAKLGYR